MARKTCPGCKTEKDLRCFYRKRAAADGHQARCKTCQRADPCRTEANRRYEKRFVRFGVAGLRMRVPAEDARPLIELQEKVEEAKFRFLEPRIVPATNQR